MLIRVQSVTKEEEEEEKEKKEEEEEEEEDDDVKDVMDVKGMCPSEMVAHVGLYVDCMVVVMLLLLYSGLHGNSISIYFLFKCRTIVGQSFTRSSQCPHKMSGCRRRCCCCCLCIVKI